MLPHPIVTALCSLLSCLVLTGCQTSGPSPSLFGSKLPAQQVSDAKSKVAGLPEPTNKAAPNKPLSLSSTEESLQRGEQELGRGNYQLAQSHFDEVLKKHPDHVKAHHRLGVLADKLNQYEQAEQHYLTALNGEPENAALLSDLGYSYFMQGRYADAERYLLKARKVDPDYPTAVANLGLLYASTDRKQEAVAMLRQIGDEAQVETIMQQVASGRFAPMQPSKEEPVASSASNVAATVKPEPLDTDYPAQEMSQAAREFVEQMRKTREAPNWADQKYAQLQQTQGRTPTQSSAPTQVAQSQPTWVQQAGPSSAPLQQPPPYDAPANLPNQQVPAGMQVGGMPANTPSAAMASLDHGQSAGAANSPVAFGRPEAAGSPASGQLEQASWTTQPMIATSPASAGTVSSPPQMQVVPNPRSTGQYTNVVQPQVGQEQLHQPVNSAPYWNQQHASQPAQVLPQITSGQPAGGGSASGSGWEQQMTIAPGPPTSPGQVAWQGGSVQPGKIQQLNGQADPNSQQPVEQAYHTQQGDQPSNITLAGQNGADSGSMSQPSTAAAGSNLYEQGRREAALLGMSAGPGQVFPYIRPMPAAQPGTDWRENGSPTPAPAWTSQNGAGATGAYAVTPNSQPIQAAVGAQPSAVRYGIAPANAMGPTSTGNPQQPYFQPQQAAGNVYQNAAGQPPQPAWGQSPPTAPYGVTPPSPTQATGAATTFSLPPANVAPAPYYQQADAATIGQTQQAGYQQTAPVGVTPAANWGGAVQPEPYRRSARTDNASQALPVIQGRSAQLPPTNELHPASPTIVPNQR